MSENLSHHQSPAPEEAAGYNYKLLVGHARTDGVYKTGEQLRTEYIHRTDELIRQMTEGIEVIDRETGERSVRVPDDVVFLDKSARPLAWLTRELWPKLAREEDGTVPPMPKCYFVNIDREQWVNTVDPNGKGSVDIDKVDQSVMRSLRSIFVSPNQKREGLTEAIDNAPTLLDGHTVLIVDEVRSSGRTLNIAMKFFEKAFPDAAVAGTHWMAGVAQKGLAQGNADLPVWYKEKSVYGRGVGNRNPNTSENVKNITQKLGAWFLSTRFPTPDPESLQLRDELKHLAHDDEVLIVPSYQRDDIVERAERLNGMSFDELKQAKRAQEGNKT